MRLNLQKLGIMLILSIRPAVIRNLLVGTSLDSLNLNLSFYRLYF